MNSDKIPDPSIMKYNVEDYVLPVRLTDSTEMGDFLVLNSNQYRVANFL